MLANADVGVGQMEKPMSRDLCARAFWVVAVGLTLGLAACSEVSLITVADGKAPDSDHGG